MHNGFLYLRYDFGFSSGPVLLEDSMKKAQINDAKFHEVREKNHISCSYRSQPFDQPPQQLQSSNNLLQHQWKEQMDEGPGDDTEERAEK